MLLSTYICVLYVEIHIQPRTHTPQHNHTSSQWSLLPRSRFPHHPYRTHVSRHCMDEMLVHCLAQRLVHQMVHQMACWMVRQMM